ncbi:MAG: shikimate dehydrogenase [Candidatus Omnitrophica bacterium]|nr:shikimate dehydrogenase [Candidatus Omnitrophota bacterium]
MQLYGILGYPLKHTLSPAMHNAAFRSLRMDAVYVPFAVTPAQLKTAIAGLRAVGVSGASVTIPHKEACTAWLDGLAGDAAILKTVNTIVVRGGRWVGYNTDGAGFLRALREEMRFEPRGKTACLLGAGGAARAVAYALAKAGLAKVHLVNRTPARAGSLAALLARHAKQTVVRTAAWRPSTIAEAAGESHLIINATPLERLPLRVELLERSTVVYDLIYHPTRLVADARRRGCVAANGLGMLLYQGALAFELWTGGHAPVSAMRKALRKTVAQ